MQQRRSSRLLRKVYASIKSRFQVKEKLKVELNVSWSHMWAFLLNLTSWSAEQLNQRNLDLNQSLCETPHWWNIEHWDIYELVDL